MILEENSRKSYAVCLVGVSLIFSFVFHCNSMQVWNKIINADRIFISGWTISLKSAENAALLLVS